VGHEAFVLGQVDRVLGHGGAVHDGGHRGWSFPAS
jgi:hypothetical protein